MELTKDHLAQLQYAAVLNGWHVTSETLGVSGQLVAEGYATAYDGDEGLVGFFATEKGINALLARGLIVKGERGPCDHSDYHFVGNGWLGG